MKIAFQLTGKIGLLVVLAVSTAVVASAQKKTPKTTRRPVVTATPIPLTGAEIISQAGQSELLDPNATIAAETPKEPVETTVDPNAQRVKELTARVKKLEASKTNEYDDQQKRLLLNLDILTRAEQRSESLRKQLFEMIEKENTVRSRLTQLDSDMRPESIDRSSMFSGSMKPEEIREMRRKSLDTEKRNMQALLTEIQTTRDGLQATLTRSDLLVEKLRLKLERDIDTALGEPEDK